MPIDMKHLARLGAQARLSELQQEIAEIQRSFPDLGGARRGRPAKQTSTVSLPGPSNDAAKRRARRPMTAAQRKAVGARMKKYWAARRKEKKA
jgi:hypothetical protein